MVRRRSSRSDVHRESTAKCRVLQVRIDEPSSGWMENDLEVRDWAREAPRKGHGTVDGFSERLDAELAKMDHLLAFFGQRRWAKSRWAGWMGKQRAMNTLASCIHGDAAQLVVGFGDGRFNPHIRGHPPAAVKGLRRALTRRGRMIDVNEYMTHQSGMLRVFDHKSASDPSLRARRRRSSERQLLG
ncbi:hypothetical protein KFL_006240080 [Klebsormidium nitens]|uniref:Uncharacterized protein n=1 Tax=Klebsormidium nitens TaxID=105231 RepID=A0A1Y1IHG2_KLENI|nr:hypothetical protein KFL_006240080 [Klebsormidium nitens]|eukprot:GAQ90305.1 hypothetical protein KFL_006240080 [Klebsormidium nitens]